MMQDAGVQSINNYLPNGYDNFFDCSLTECYLAQDTDFVLVSIFSVYNEGLMLLFGDGLPHFECRRCRCEWGVVWGIAHEFHE